MTASSTGRHETPSNAGAVAFRDLDAPERARRMHSMALRALDERREADIARDMDTSPATLSRIKNERLEDALLLLAHLGLTIVPVDACVVPRERFEAVMLLARERLLEATTEDMLACR